MSVDTGEPVITSKDEISVDEEPPRKRLMDRSRTFGPASERPFRRRSSDWVRLIFALVMFVVLARRVNHVNATERSIFEFFNSLPSGLHSLFRVLYAVAALWAVGLVVVAAFVEKRWRLGRDLVIAGMSAWLIARGLGAYYGHSSSLSSSFDAVFRLSEKATFPVPRLALVVAVVCVASPYLTRPTRRIGQLFVIALAIAAMYLGAGYPNDVLAAIVLGWGIAAAVHLVFKSPGGRPTTTQMKESLAELGIDATDVRLVPEQPVGYTLMSAKAANDTTLMVKVLGRDDASTQLAAKVWRFIAYKDSGPGVFITRRQQVEHEAYVLLLAADGGVRVPRVEAAGTAGPGAALLILDSITGPVVSDIGPNEMTDELVESTWKQVAALQSRGIAHGALNTSSIKLSPTGPVLVNFGAATGSASQSALGADVAELLTSMASVVGEERVVNGARRGLSKSQLEDSLPMLQSQALTSTTRHQTKRREMTKRVSSIRDLVATATETDPPTLTQLQRVRPASLGMAIGTLLGLAALMSQVGSPQQVWDTIKSADWAWVFLAFAISMLQNLAWAIGLMGAVPIRLGIWPATETQIGMSFARLAVPGVGATAMQIRFLQKQGLDVSVAVATGAVLSEIALIVTQLVLFITALLLSPAKINTSKIPTSTIEVGVLLVVLICFVAAGLVIGVPRLRRSVGPRVKDATSTMWQVVRSPARLALLLSGNAVAALMAAWCYQACLIAYGGHLDFATLLAANIFIGTIAGLIPVPGGNAAVGAVGMSGALVAFGVPNEIAVSAVLTYQIVSNYLPALPGWIATRDLLRKQYL